MIAALLAIVALGGPLDYPGLKYGPDSNHKLDLFLARGGEDLVIWLTGGWEAQPLGVEPSGFLGEVRAAGYHVCMLRVRPSPETTWPGPQDDVALAVSKLRTFADRFSEPLETFTLIGKSAGAIRAGGAEFADNTAKLFDALVIMSAAADLTALNPFSGEAAPYFGAFQHWQVAKADLEAASMVPLIEQHGTANAPPVLVFNSGTRASALDPFDVHGAYHALLLDAALTQAQHPHALVWTPDEALTAPTLLGWLEEVLP